MVCFLYKKLVFSPSGTCQHGVFSIYAIIAQLDRALASDVAERISSVRELRRFSSPARFPIYRLPVLISGIFPLLFQTTSSHAVSSFPRFQTTI